MPAHIASAPGTDTALLDMQERLLPFMLNPKSYPHQPKRVRLVQTHSSFVFVVAPFVYKIKKSVNFGFLNFSTLEKRRHFCEREVVLNRRLSPSIYLGVVPISIRNGEFEFGTSGDIIEYAVQMRKLSERYFLDALLQRNSVTPSDIDRIANTLKEFYEAQHPTREIEEWGAISRLQISTDENFRQTEQFNTLTRAAFQTIRDYTDEFYQRHAALFEARVQEGWIRDCHGDLHLEHIHLTPRSLHIYDCIEFNDRLRYVDVASDVSFLAMDLDFNGRPDLARHFLTTISAALSDSDMLRLVPFYKCYRAYVRGKVESLHAIDHSSPAIERNACADRARKYFRLALRYTVTADKPMVFAVIGRIASGKSTLANALAQELDCAVVSSDRVRKELAGFPLYERTSAEARSHLYSQQMTENTYQRLISTAEAAVQSGRSIVLDATFARTAHRKLIAERLRKQGAELQLIEAIADDETIKQRLADREGKPDEISDARLEDFEMLAGKYEPVDPSIIDCIRFSTATSSEQLELAELLHKLMLRRL